MLFITVKNDREKREIMTEKDRNEQLEKRFVELTWLNYFNRYLYEHGTISEGDYKKMTEKIAIFVAKRYPGLK